MINLLANHPIEEIESNDEKYPQLLKEIPDAPSIIYVRGTLLPNETCFAIVGTRRASDYGKEIAFSFAQSLTQAGLTIVSGMARGIDTFAHRGALEAVSPHQNFWCGGKGRTIAVLGTGLSERVIYPQENLGLAKKILGKGGCLISEYPPKTHGDKFTFPKRNRLISAMSLGVLVVEAKFGSGALITAKWAKKQERKVFAIPGSIHSKNSQGPNWLIKKGAILTEKPEDILQALKLQNLSIFQKQNQDLFSQSQENVINGSEQKILIALTQGSLHIDRIIETTNLSPQTVSATLSLLEINNKVKNLGANVYAIIK